MSKLSNEELLALLDRVKQVLPPEICRRDRQVWLDGKFPYLVRDYDCTHEALLSLAAIAKVENWKDNAEEFGTVVSRVEEFYFDADSLAWEWVADYANCCVDDEEAQANEELEDYLAESPKGKVNHD